MRINNFSEGEEIVCISDDFPAIKKYGTATEAKIKPSIGERLIVDEILGDFLRFDRYDTETSFNWWHFSRFAPIDNEKHIAINHKKLELTV